MEYWSKQGIPFIAVSLGGDGALVSYEGTVFKVVPPTVRAVNAVGCGDAMVAGTVVGLTLGLDIEETLGIATASAAANALEHKAGCVSKARINTLRHQVRIERI